MSNPLERRLAAEAILADEMAELERLREYEKLWTELTTTGVAADEINRLRAENNTLRRIEAAAWVAFGASTWKKAQDALRAALGEEA